MRRNNKKLICISLFLMITVMFAGCGREKQGSLFRYGTTAYGPEMGNAGLNPHDNYSGWSAVRYGVGETLFRFNDKMELEPWLATAYEQKDEYTVVITLQQGVFFSSGRKMDAQAVKECLENLIAVHDRAPKDLQIKEIIAQEQRITIVSSEKVPALLHFLSDPYGAIIDMDAGVSPDGNVSGTGPFIAQDVSDYKIILKKNEAYWGGDVKVDEVIVQSITDGDTLTMALQAGEIDAVQGLPYASYSLFQNNDAYTISSTNTSRTFFCAMNYKTQALQDKRVREAIAMGIDKESFTTVLLAGNGTAAKGPFPTNFSFGDLQVWDYPYDQEGAKKQLQEAGYEDSDGDGYVDQQGKNLTLRWLTYPGRQELPLLAEAAQASLAQIGIQLEVNATANHLDVINKGEWDIYASAFVTAPTGDPAYFFTTHALEDSAKNRGQYYNKELEELAVQLSLEFDQKKRTSLAILMQQMIVEDASFLFASHLRMSFVMQKKVKGFEAHPSDYYEITKDLEMDDF